MNAQTIDELVSSRSVTGDQAAVVAMSRDAFDTTSRAELLERAGRLAAGLQETGLEPGGRTVIFAPNSADWVIAALGVINAGGVVVPLDTQMPREDLEHVLTDSEPQFIVTTAKFRDRLPEDLGDARTYLIDAAADASDAWEGFFEHEPAAAVAKSDDVAVIFYTSGTTGPPKGVPLTHRNLTSNVEALCAQELADDQDRVLVPLPFHHVYPFTVGILVPLTIGATIIVPFSLVGPQIVRALRDGEATVMLGVPRLYEAVWKALEDRVSARGRIPALLFRLILGMSKLARHRLGLRVGRSLFKGLHNRLAPGLRLVVAGGAALDPGLGRNLQALGWEVATGYGLSETSPILAYNPPDRLRLEAAGLPLPGVELAIDDSGSSDGRGEVMARGPNVFAGYLNLPDKTKAVLDNDGWFRTGDTGEIDDGYLRLHGRESSMIVLSGGENVDPERAEEALQAIDEVREAGVLAHDDRLAAVVVPESRLLREVTGEDLEKRVKDSVKKAAKELPSHHRPGVVRVALDPLPRTRLGKLRRHKLEELFEELGKEDTVSDARPEPVSPESMAPEDQQLLSDPGAERTWDYLAERFHDIRLTPDSSLAEELGIDSLSWVDLTLALQDRAGIDLDDSAIERVETVRELLQEAAGASEAKEGRGELKKQLEDPESLLVDDQRKDLEPLGPARRSVGRALLGPVRLLSRLLVRVDVQGRLPDDGPFLIAPRHLSFVDPLALLPALSRQQLESLYWAGLEAYLFSNRFSRAFSRTAHVLPIDPGSAPRRSLALAAACLKRGHSLIWFPEGQRSPDGRLQRLRPGIGLVLAAQPVPVVPVWIEGTREVMAPGRHFPRPGKRVRVIIGDPVSPETYGTDEREIVKSLQSALEDLGESSV
ncbi:Long-chain-fatty-acid--CoA ligase [Thioalkalivibrio nitratireducens DSM 14787]|uniref:Long-chain-fatty-acid--CoA ligase n=1 Tax=Thioalkalivibrio nitratireducens (strain DSM 14787 / UNIQEM 213 / ALEN2) TaxID=1255043 RepID=L0DWM4_THIND|nr:AMP-binding protein [Thioalkalivibrio nitratireducens]AGA32776.1 Long-chain-fatty-acid--CoA ligase [Thioalkalivibrio nitratireducens DSM 14787]